MTSKRLTHSSSPSSVDSESGLASNWKKHRRTRMRYYWRVLRLADSGTPEIVVNGALRRTYYLCWCAVAKTKSQAERDEIRIHDYAVNVGLRDISLIVRAESPDATSWLDPLSHKTFDTSQPYTRF